MRQLHYNDSSGQEAFPEREDHETFYKILSGSRLTWHDNFVCSRLRRTEQHDLFFKRETALGGGRYIRRGGQYGTEYRQHSTGCGRRSGKRHSGGGNCQRRRRIRNAGSDTVLVHICGEVRTPGVYELTADSRICDVLLLAGGFTADADTEAVNMAAGIEDGMQIVIPTETDRTQEMTENSSDRTGEKAAGKTESQLVNINTADKETLMSLPGIGAGKAEAVIAYREAGGVFKDIKDIMLVDGIKEGVYAKIKDKICVK